MRENRHRTMIGETRVRGLELANVSLKKLLEYRVKMAFGISLCRCYVGNLDRLLGSDRLAKRTARRRMERTAPARLGRSPAPRRTTTRRIGTRCEHQGHTNGVHEHRSLCCYADRQD
jgi:hypothetical protein